MKSAFLAALAILTFAGCRDDGGGSAVPPDVVPPSVAAPSLRPESATFRGSIDLTAGTDLSVCGHRTTPDQYGSWTAMIPIAEAAGCVISLRNGNGVTVWSGEATVGVARR